MTNVDVTYPSPYDIEVELPPVPRAFVAFDHGPQGDPGPAGPQGPPGSPTLLASTPAHLGRWSYAPITAPPGTSPVVASVSAGAGLAVTAPSTGVPDRALMLLPGVHRDVEVRATIAPPAPQAIVAHLPQVGIALRVADNGDGTTSGLIADSNVASHVYRSIWSGLWEWPADGHSGSLRLAAGAVSTTTRRRELVARSAQRSSIGDVYRVGPTPADWAAALAGGDLVDIDGPVDPEYAQTGVAATVFGDAVGVTAGAGSATKAPAVESASIRLTDVAPDTPHPLSIYPLRMAFRVEGNTSKLKVWPSGAPEPDWQAVIDWVAPTDGSAPMSLPPDGQVGLVANHLEGDAQIIYDSIEIIDLY